MRDAVKGVAHGIAWLIVTPSVLSFALRSRLVGRDRAFHASTQAWSLLPGLLGQYLRRAFLSRTLPACARSAAVEFGCVFSSASATIGENAYIGPHCHIGWAIVEAEALLAAGVHVPSGARSHGIDDPDTPIRDQPAAKSPVRIGAGSWIGSNAIVMADIGREAIVGAGAVVTKPIPERTVAGGVPARVLRHRDRSPIESVVRASFGTGG